MNIGCYKEAAEHFLTALLMHQAPPDSQYASSQATIKHSNESSNLWETLRRTFILMERPDLSEMAIVGADLERFRKEFDF
jgi:peroxin-5